MLWYLLYPLRGTTQPPRLSANHPVRRAFYRHGKTTAQHWLVAMLASVAVAMAFSYPTILLSENPTAGFAAHPHHVWTTAKPFEGDPNQADVELRQVWVHGSYMKALEKDVLKSGLGIQRAVVGGEHLTQTLPTLNERLRASPLAWGYHSPLMYWNNSAQMIDDDDDIARTINDRSRTASSLNVALRPASVFAGKQFDRWKLTAADALVITLMNKVEAGASERWQERMRALAAGPCRDCTLFPRDGVVTRHRVYEFSFTPLSASESLALTFAYSCMALYVLLSLRRLKAFHSRFGLVVTAITQMTCSILASITICGILRINLSMIPQNVYPFVVLVIGLENMFRVINAIVTYPPTMATELRIGNALGDVGPVSIATVAQNLAILSLLSRFVSPGVAAFCAFACIATLFDAFFLLTFFIAVLNVDIRRFELQDALARSNHAHKPPHHRRPSPSPHPWFDALVQGRLPFSTRMAGTAVTTTFVLSLNYHFFERREADAGALRRALGLVRGGVATAAAPSVADFDTFAPPPMNATLTPGEWMRMQDFETAREVMRLAKPGADSFVIRVFAPLIVVLAGADRTGATGETETWAHVLRSFAIHHFYPVAVAVVFAVAFVAVLMNFLLYSESGDDYDSELERHEDALTIQTVALPHKLDIVQLCGHESGHFVSIGLDRSIAICVTDRTQQSRRTISVPSDALSLISWPTRSTAIDESGEWMACLCADNRVMIYSCLSGRFVQTVRCPDDQLPVVFQFVRMACDAQVLTNYLILLTSRGHLVTIPVGTGESNPFRLSETPLLSASLHRVSGHDLRLVVVTEAGKIVTYNWTGSLWTESISQLLQVQTLYGRMTGSVTVSVYPELGPDLLVVTTSTAIRFLDSHSLETTGELELDRERDPQGSLLLGQATKCPACGSVALQSVTVAGDASHADECDAVTFHAASGGDDSPICLRRAAASCHSFDDVRRSPHHVPNAGAWHAVKSHAMLGFRRRRVDGGADGNVINNRNSSAIRRRRHVPPPDAQASTTPGEWEAYKLSAGGEFETVSAGPGPDVDSAAGDAATLYVHKAGPVVALDAHSVGVAFGNCVKIVRATRRGGMARHDPGASLLERQTSISRKKLAVRKGQ